MGEYEPAYNPSSSTLIGGYEDHIAASSMHATARAFGLLARSSELQDRCDSLAQESVSLPQMHCAINGYGHANRLIYNMVVSGWLMVRIQGLKQKAHAIMPPEQTSL